MRSERGSISLTVAMGSLILCTFGLAVADLGSMMAARSRAQAAADAAALAAIAQQAPVLASGEEPGAAARAAAEANGGSLLSCSCEVGSTEAIVEVGVPVKIAFVSGWRGRVARARARAELDPDVLSYRDPG